MYELINRRAFKCACVQNQNFIPNVFGYLYVEKFFLDDYKDNN